MGIVEETLTRYRARRVFHVRGVARPLDVLACDGIPKIGDEWDSELWSGVVCVDLHVTRQGRFGRMRSWIAGWHRWLRWLAPAWRVTCSYERRGAFVECVDARGGAHRLYDRMAKPEEDKGDATT